MNAGGDWWIPICPVVHNAIQCPSMAADNHWRPPAAARELSSGGYITPSGNFRYQCQVSTKKDIIQPYSTIYCTRNSRSTVQAQPVVYHSLPLPNTTNLNEPVEFLFSMRRAGFEAQEQICKVRMRRKPGAKVNIMSQSSHSTEEENTTILNLRA
ncbi:hypothetical protein FB451DRAFT_1177595 [Mycena latifolia]|nr:hypothetical protein FB451DRAFT_1177595 [Mycena latifolia]